MSLSVLKIRLTESEIRVGVCKEGARLRGKGTYVGGHPHITE